MKGEIAFLCTIYFSCISVYQRPDDGSKFETNHEAVNTTTTIRHELGSDRSVSALSNGLFKIFPRCLPPFGLQFSIILGILSFIPVTCSCSQFDLYLLSLSSTSSPFNSSIISPFLLWSKSVYPAVLKNFISTDDKLLCP